MGCFVTSCLDCLYVLFQLEKTARTDLLVKDLYVENSNLVKCLELTEKREKTAESKLFGSEEKCRVLQRLVRQISRLQV